jgi:hypothetical protein
VGMIGHQYPRTKFIEMFVAVSGLDGFVDEMAMGVSTLSSPGDLEANSLVEL